MRFDKKITPWRDTHLRITGSAVLGLQGQFVKDWYSASREKAVFTERYREIFEADAINSLKLSKEGYTKRSIVNKMGEQVFRLFTPLL